MPGSRPRRHRCPRERERAFLGVHVYGDFPQPLLSLAEHLSNVADREGLGDTNHDQAARLVAAPAGRKLLGNLSRYRHEMP